MKNKVLIISPSIKAKGGIASVVSGYKNSELEKNFNIKYIETYNGGSFFKRIIFALKAYIKFLVIIIFWNPSIVHIHSSFGGSFYRKMPFIVISNLLNKLVINHIHGSYYDEFYFRTCEIKKKLITKVYNQCDVLIALSVEAKNNLEKISSSKIIIIENYGIVQNKEIIYSRDEKENIVLFLGFITKRKGCFDIPKILKIVKKEIPNIKFILAGEGQIEELKKEISTNDIKNVVFTGWVSGIEKHNLLSKASVFLLPSYSEGMPMSILDAMGYGLPIVASNIGGIPKIVHDNKNGYLSNPGDVVKFSKAIIQILTNQELRISMGEESIEVLETSFSLKKHIKKLNRIYNDLLKVNI